MEKLIKNDDLHSVNRHTRAAKSKRKKGRKQSNSLNTEQLKILNVLKKLKPNDALISFKNLSQTISKASDVLSTKHFPLLYELTTSYTTARNKIQSDFTGAADILSKFIIKGWKMLEQGISNDDKNELIKLETKLDRIVTNSLHDFVESARRTLIKLQSQLLLDATSGEVQHLFDIKDEDETKLLQIEPVLANISSKRSTNQKIIDLLELPSLIPTFGSEISGNRAVFDRIESIKNLSSTIFNGPAMELKNRMTLEVTKQKANIQKCKDTLERQLNSLQLLKQFRNISRHSPSIITPIGEHIECNTHAEITDLRMQNDQTDAWTQLNSRIDVINQEMTSLADGLRDKISNYRNKIETYAERRVEQKALFWMYSWKARDVNASNEKRSTEENIDRLVGRNNIFQHIFKNQSVDDLVNTLSAGNRSLSYHKIRQAELDKEYNETKKRHDYFVHRLSVIVEEIEIVYNSTGTKNPEGIKIIDELCRAIQSAHESMTSAYMMVRFELLAMDMDRDLLVSSLLSAINVLNLIDRYRDTREVKRITRMLTTGAMN